MDTATSLLGRLPRGKPRDGSKALLQKLRGYLSEAQVASVRQAYLFAAEAHKDQKRQTGEPYVTHPIAVADILADLRLDYPSIAAALLHDVIEDTPTAKEHIAERFGNEVAELVDGVSKLDQIKFKSKAEAQAESLRKMMMAMAEDIRVILVKLADRLHNMRTLGVMPPAKRRRIARETLDIYAPIANRLGINSVRLELEDLGFQSLYPNRYRVIEHNLKKTLGNQKQIIRKITSQLKNSLHKSGIRCKVLGREKHIYSVYQKMLNKSRGLHDIVDVYGFRLVVDTADTCYRALGAVHRIYKPMPGRFKDYIAIPRVNGYQSLHTTLSGPHGVPIEVQIRTDDMDNVAESGIAAHWLYKSGESQSGVPQARAREWLQGLIETQAASDSEEFLESVKIDLFPDKVYVFTPRGDILRLPRGSSAVDFAYAVHTGVGNRCIAAKVDRRLVPLRTPLRNGQSVEIITAKGGKPNPAWLNFVVTAKARSSIRQFLKDMRRSEAVDLGKRLVNATLQEHGTRLRKISKARLRAVLDELKLDDANVLFEEVGMGRQLAPLIARRLIADADGNVPAGGSGSAHPLAIAGTEGMVLSYARCCYPLPGDPIMGYLTSGRGLVIHRDTCGNLAEFRKQPEKWINVVWETHPGREFHVEIRVDAVNQMGVLAAVAAKIAETRCNIEHVSVAERGGDASSMTFLLQVESSAHLDRVVRNIESMAEILGIERVCA